MIVYVGAGEGEFRELVVAAGHGQMASRQTGSWRIPSIGPWALDNGAWIDFKHFRQFDTEQFLDRIARLSDLPDDRLPDWCVVPDIVANRMSLPFSLRWRQALSKSDRRLKWYLAVQDFMTFDDVQAALCAEPFDGLFIGGSDAWRSGTVEQWIGFGHDQGLPVHLARANGPNKLQWAVNMGADSIDGTGWVRAYYKWLPHLQNVPEPQNFLMELGPDLPEAWIRFGVYLESIWSKKDWKRWSKQECLVTEANPEHIRVMTPEEYLDWIEGNYLGETLWDPEPWRPMTGKLFLDENRGMEFATEAEQEFWKRHVMWEFERIMLPPVPPAPEPARKPL